MHDIVIDANLLAGVTRHAEIRRLHVDAAASYQLQAETLLSSLPELEELSLRACFRSDETLSAVCTFLISCFVFVVFSLNCMVDVLHRWLNIVPTCSV